MGIDIRLAARTTKRRTPQEIKELNYRFMEASSFGYGKNPITENYDYNKSIFFYEVYSLSRLYADSYARGHWPEINSAIDWLRFNFPEADIIYGGDHTDIEDLPVLTMVDQKHLNDFWCTSGGLTYRNRIPDRESFKRLCPNCDVIMSQYMFSGENGAIACLGCKFREETKDGGNSWFELKKED